MNLKSGEIPATNSNAQAFFRIIHNPFQFKLFLLKKLPSAFFSGVRVKQVNEDACLVTVPYKWFSTNPFRSTYFACLSMAAEMSTGVLAMAHVYGLKPHVSMLVTKVEGRFLKKATGNSLFTCSAGQRLREVIQTAYTSGEAQEISVDSIGKNIAGETVAEFTITWSFKRKS